MAELEWLSKEAGIIGVVVWLAARMIIDLVTKNKSADHQINNNQINQLALELREIEGKVDQSALELREIEGKVEDIKGMTINILEKTNRLSSAQDREEHQRAIELAMRRDS